MTKFRYNKILLLSILIGLLAAIWLDMNRSRVEETTTTVEMVMDYEDIAEMAQTEGQAVPQLMQEFKQAGITSLAVYETTLEKLNKSGKLTVIPGTELMAQTRLGQASGAAEIGARLGMRAEDIYIFGKDPVFEEVRSDLARRLGPDRVRATEGLGERMMAIQANYEKVVKWNLGLPTDEMKEVAGQGFFVVARPSNYTKVKPDDIDAVFSRIDSVDSVSAVVFTGEEVLGFPDLLPQTAQRFRERGLTLGLIEHPLQLQFVKQEGLMQLIQLVDYKGGRIYVIPKEEQVKLKPKEALERWPVTDQERNVRLNFIRKFDKPDPGKTIVETNLAYVSQIRDQLAEKGYLFGRAGTFPPYFPPRWPLVLVAFGATAAGVLYLTLLRPLPKKLQYVMLIVITGILSVPILMGSGTLVRQAVALVSAVVFPALSMTWFLDHWHDRKPYQGSALMRILVDGVLYLTLAVLMSLAGGLFVGAILSDVRFFMELELYRGVKVTFALPLILITLTYLARYDLFSGVKMEQNPRGIWRQLVRVLNYPIYVKSLVAVAAGAVVAWVFIGRSGHTAGVPVPAIELKLRSLLEQTMYARPREKEFMIGHPAFMLLVMAIYRSWPRVMHYLLVVAATIGQGSLVETFAHIRTPIFMSFARAIDGWATGAVIGILAVVGIQIIGYLSAILGRRYAEDE